MLINRRPDTLEKLNILDGVDLRMLSQHRRSAAIPVH